MIELLAYRFMMRMPAFVYKCASWYQYTCLFSIPCGMCVRSLSCSMVHKTGPSRLQCVLLSVFCRQPHIRALVGENKTRPKGVRLRSISLGSPVVSLSKYIELVTRYTSYDFLLLPNSRYCVYPCTNCKLYHYVELFAGMWYAQDTWLCVRRKKGQTVN